MLPPGKYFLGDPGYVFRADSLAVIREKCDSFDHHDTRAPVEEPLKSRGREGRADVGGTYFLGKVNFPSADAGTSPDDDPNAAWEIAVYETGGDGGFEDQHGTVYCVDSGKLAAVPYDLCCTDDRDPAPPRGCSDEMKTAALNKLGLVVEHDRPFPCFVLREDGRVFIVFGDRFIHCHWLNY